MRACVYEGELCPIRWPEVNASLEVTKTYETTKGTKGTKERITKYFFYFVFFVTFVVQFVFVRFVDQRMRLAMWTRARQMHPASFVLAAALLVLSTGGASLRGQG